MSHSGRSSSIAINNNKGKEVLVDVPVQVAKEKPHGKGPAAVEADDGTPEWLAKLMRTVFWEPCKKHWNLNRGDQCVFCLSCYKVTCPRCTHCKKPGHRRLKIRRYVYRSVVSASDMLALNIDVTRVQTYVINGQRVLHLRPMNRSINFRPQTGTPRCITCRTWLRNAPNLFCSLVCEERADVSQDDYSGPEAEIRYKSLQVNMLSHSNRASAGGEPSEAADDEEDDHAPVPLPLPPPPPSAHRNASRRRRRRKQALPARAPFF